jgi:putative transposase
MAVVRVTQASRFALKYADRLARIHARVTNVRADALHKATTDLAARYETIVAEDLNVTGKQEPGTASADETGTAARQREAAA